MIVDIVPFFVRVLSLYAGLIVPHVSNNESAMISLASTRVSRDCRYQSRLSKHQKATTFNTTVQCNQDYYVSAQWILNRQVSASQT